MLFFTQSRNLSSYWKLRNWYANLVKPAIQKPPYSHVIQVGDPRLRSSAESIALEEIATPQIKKLIAHMKYVLKKYNCVGLSAPQIGVHKRVFLVEFNESHAKNYSEKEFKIKEMCLVPLTVVKMEWSKFMGLTTANKINLLRKYI